MASTLNQLVENEIWVKDNKKHSWPIARKKPQQNRRSAVSKQKQSKKYSSKNLLFSFKKNEILYLDKESVL